MNPNDATYIPQIVYDQSRSISSMHVLVVLLTLVTIGMWATFSVTSATFGDLGIISLLFMVRHFYTSYTNISKLVCHVWHRNINPTRFQFLFMAHSISYRRRQRARRCMSMFLAICIFSHVKQKIGSPTIWFTFHSEWQFIQCTTHEQCLARHRLPEHLGTLHDHIRITHCCLYHSPAHHCQP